MLNLLGEFLGTAILVILGDGVVANVILKRTKGEGSGWIEIATGWGLAVAMAVYMVGRISGGHINPAVTVALASIGSFPWSQVPGYLAAQTAGAFVGAVVTWVMYHPHFAATPDTGTKLAVFCTGPAIRNPLANFVSEAIGTAMLVFGVLAIGRNALELTDPSGLDLSKVFSGGLQPLLVGFLVWSIGLSLGGTTGYAINPARDFGPRLAHALLPIAGKGGSDWSYAWIPVFGPLLGGALGAFIFAATGF